VISFDARPALPPEIPGSHNGNLQLSLDRESIVRVGALDGFGGDGPMGKMTGRDPNRLTMSLVGNFRLCDPDGRSIRVSEKKARVLLAMVATARCGLGSASP